MTSSGIAYFDEAIDITNEVIKAVNAKTPASTK
jgi:Skp family chaperone for outer membrane proteins